MIFLISTTQRCGSTWLTRILSQLVSDEIRAAGDAESVNHFRAEYVDGNAKGFERIAPTPDSAISKLASEIMTRSVFARGKFFGVFKTHDVPAKDFDRVAAKLPDLRLFTVSRDFKDVVVSRYFYYRYYWHTDPGLGPLPAWIPPYMQRNSTASDADALSRIATDPILNGWASDWAAFETPFQTKNALRVSYEGMLAGKEMTQLELFLGRSIPSVNSFAVEQSIESKLGRQGESRFNRCGKSGQWKKYFSEPTVAGMDSLASEALVFSQKSTGSAR